jgi:hypothetical protein
MGAPTLDDLGALVALWQQRLELQDWHVEVTYARAWELTTQVGHCAGEIDYLVPARWACMRIRDPQDYVPTTWMPEDIERTVVHELLHLHLGPFAAEDDSPADVAQHQMINALARALVALARGQARYRPVPRDG